jgi:hypothetical protein
MRLLLHIGTEKTGTTSSQAWFRDNREALRRQGVLYPVSLGDADHRKLSVCGRDPRMPDDGFIRYGIGSPEQHAAFVGQVREAFEREVDSVEEGGIDTVVVSSEHLHSRVVSRTMVASVREFFGDRFETIRVVVYLRPQVDLAVSFLGTAAKHGTRVTTSWFDDVQPGNTYYNYDALVGRWEEGFGEGSVDVVQYARGESFANDVCRQCGLDTTCMPGIGRHNTSSSLQFVAMMNAVNDGGEGRLPAIIRDRMSAYLAGVGGSPLSIGRDLAETVQSRFHESNARLAARRPELSLAALNGDLRTYDTDSNLETLDRSSPFAAELRTMLESYELSLARETARALLAEADLLVERGDTRQAEAKVREALHVVAQLAELPRAQGALDRLRQRAEALLAACAERPAP